MKFGTRHAEETKRKMSESRKGENHYNYGGTISERHKKAISVANKGKQFSEEHKRRIGKASGNRTIETRQKLSESHKGKIASIETCQKMSDSRKGEKNGMFGKTHSSETRKKISIGNKGKLIPIETRRKMSNALKGEKNPNYGKHFSEEHRKKISTNHADMSGKNNPAYKDGRCGTKDYGNYVAAQKRAQKLNQTPKLTKVEQERIKIIYRVASIIFNSHVDHIIPLSKGGLHHPDNLQILDGKLNDSKKDKWPLSEEENKRYKGLRL